MSCGCSSKVKKEGSSVQVTPNRVVSTQGGKAIRKVAQVKRRAVKRPAR